MESRLSTGLSGKLEQHQHLSRNMQNSLELLAMPLAALENRLTAELTVNPMLEEVSADSFDTAPADRDTETEDENDYESNSIIADQWSDELPLPGLDTDDDKQDFLGSLPAPPPQLRTMLMTELMAMPLPEEQLQIALEIVSALNDDGFLTTPLADVAMTCDVDMDQALHALELVQNIAPAGVAARDLPECLKLQLRRMDKLTPELSRLLDEGIDDLEKNRIPALEKKLGITSEQLKNMLATLRSLDPAPGREAGSFTSVVIPDLIITAGKDGSYTAAIQKENTSRIIISPLYEKLLENQNLSREDRAYLNEKLAGAKELLNAVNMRESTLKRLGDILIKYQKDFLDRGAKHLHSLTMKTAAEELDLNESTISRAVAEKFVDTPQGIFPLKHFFSTGYNTAGGADVAASAVMEKIRSMIDAEDPAIPLSDENIANILKKDGISIARRTVAKYRDIMKIPSSSMRKKFY